MKKHEAEDFSQIFSSDAFQRKLSELKRNKQDYKEEFPWDKVADQ